MRAVWFSPEMCQSYFSLWYDLVYIYTTEFMIGLLNMVYIDPNINTLAIPLTVYIISFKEIAFRIKVHTTSGLDFCSFQNFAPLFHSRFINLDRSELSLWEGLFVLEIPFNLAELLLIFFQELKFLRIE